MLEYDAGTVDERSVEEPHLQIASVGFDAFISLELPCSLFQYLQQAREAEKFGWVIGESPLNKLVVHCEGVFNVVVDLILNFFSATNSFFRQMLG